MGGAHKQDVLDAPIGVLGLSRAALQAAILAQLEEFEELDAEAISSAVAGVIDTNNQEIVRHLRLLFSGQFRDSASVGGPP
jgi:hypothetical protein